jgi:hypothetical protein
MMAKKARLSFVLISLCLVFSLLLIGCQSLNSSKTAANSTVSNTDQDKGQDQNTDSAKKAQAINLAKQLGLPAQIALAGLGLEPARLKVLKTENASCEAWGDQLSGFLLRDEARQKIVNIDEVKIALSAVELITTGQFLMDIPKLVIGVSGNVATFPIDLYHDVEKLKGLRDVKNKKILQSLARDLKKDIAATKSKHTNCKPSIRRYLKSKLGLVEQQCTPVLSSPALRKLRDLAVPNLALNTAGDVVNNDTAWTAAQIFALTHGWTVTDDTRIALAKALAENPDLWPLVDNGIDVLLQRENADTVIAFLGKVKEANSTCGPKQETMLTKLP